MNNVLYAINFCEKRTVLSYATFTIIKAVYVFFFLSFVAGIYKSAALCITSVFSLSEMKIIHVINRMRLSRYPGYLDFG